MTRQRIDITLDDVIKLLVDEQPRYSELSKELRDQLEKIGKRRKREHLDGHATNKIGGHIKPNVAMKRPNTTASTLLCIHLIDLNIWFVLYSD